MRARARLSLSLLIVVSLSGALPAFAGSGAGADEAGSPGRYEGDDPRWRLRDEHAAGVTAMDQSNDPEHVRLTAGIRSEIVKERSLSIGARNIKIVTTDDGTVWLRGLVKSPQERERVISVVRRVIGDRSLQDRLDVRGVDPENRGRKGGEHVQ